MNIALLQPPQVLCEESVRAALLDTVPADMAYALRPKVTEWLEGEEVRGKRERERMRWLQKVHT